MKEMNDEGVRKLALAILSKYEELLRKSPTTQSDECDFRYCKRRFEAGGFYWWFVLAERTDLYPKYRKQYVENESIAEWQEKHPELVMRRGKEE